MTVGRILLISSLAFPLIWGSFIFSGLQCQTVDPSFCRVENCTIRALRRGVKEINGRVRLFKLPVDNVTVNQGDNSTIYNYKYMHIIIYRTFIDSRKTITSRLQ